MNSVAYTRLLIVQYVYKVINSTIMRIVRIDVKHIYEKIPNPYKTYVLIDPYRLSLIQIKSTLIKH
jgi:hypothetical protein